MITIYTTPTCTYCTEVKNFLTGKGIDFTERDVAKDEDARARMVEISGARSVPLTVVGDDAVRGFDEETLIDVLKKNDLLPSEEDPDDVTDEE